MLLFLSQYTLDVTYSINVCTIENEILLSLVQYAALTSDKSN